MRFLALQVLPVRKLLVLHPATLRETVCGTETIDWGTAAQLREQMNVTGFGRHSSIVDALVAVMMDMDQPRRRSFLQFVSGCATLPRGGLKALMPRLAVSRKAVAGGEITQLAVDQALPSASTCFNKVRVL